MSAGQSLQCTSLGHVVNILSTASVGLKSKIFHRHLLEKYHHHPLNHWMRSPLNIPMPFRSMASFPQSSEFFAPTLHPHWTSLTLNANAFFFLQREYFFPYSFNRIISFTWKFIFVCIDFPLPCVLYGSIRRQSRLCYSNIALALSVVRKTWKGMRSNEWRKNLSR